MAPWEIYAALAVDVLASAVVVDMSHDGLRCQPGVSEQGPRNLLSQVGLSYRKKPIRLSITRHILQHQYMSSSLHCHNRNVYRRSLAIDLKTSGLQMWRTCICYVRHAELCLIIIFSKGVLVFMLGIDWCSVLFHSQHTLLVTVIL